MRHVKAERGIRSNRMKKMFLGVVALAAGAALAQELVDFSRAGHPWRAHNHVATRST